ncbi:MAG: rhodanese-like domain-containing protein [Haliscomenobacter sp.]|nr:rhodanese-like domain-containing protein [Haliscomenobacter sp.]MBK8655042.1 rhodanese-like domain-containing protein [Haliscomenobacter sp.]MBP9076866.1 rhodanese-like domain-containing protein [Haliscomenobacter sp.]MBP9872598.1 rhodanese-like domain-containing protein [Haliscomenobacter sp.]
MKRFFFAFVLLATVASCQGQHGNGASSSSGSSNVLTASEFKAKIAQKGVQIVDVRTAGEFASGHISGAKNIDATSYGFENQAGSQLDKNQPVAVYCRSGVRSARAAAALRRMGFKTVYDLRGGYLAWMAQ